ncbi:N-alpha-acetyltransferase 25, NatB auxiliary subunit, partial [Stegodyphus mimosarum]
MAARSHVDSGVNERRLRPIYDCLDNGNNKKALQEADKLLKKQKDFLCAKALKALALIRLGRQDEAVGTLQEVHVEDPTDDPTLQAMTICYRELHKPQLIADAYERATKKDPQNEELLSHLFMSHVRNGDYKKQQQTAVALYKLKPKNPYYFWAIMSIVMQANVAEEKLAKQMLLPLAERMTEKFVKENKLEAEAEVQLYLMILEQQEKYEEAIEVLDGPLREKLSPYQDVLHRRKAEFLIKLQRWPEANKAFKKLILGNPDQWSYYVEYFKSVYNLIESNWQPDENSIDTPEGCVDYNFQMAIDFVAALVEEQNGTRDGRKLRGPYLAQIELLNELLKRNDPLANKIGSMVEILASFYEQFGSKPSCFVDLSHVISTMALKEEDIKMLLDKIKASLVAENSTEDITLPKDLKQMNRHLCYSRLCHYFGFQEDWNQHQQLTYAHELIERYHHGLQFGSDLLSTENQPADNYCLLAAHTLINIWKQTGDERLIAQVIVLLEQSLKSTPANFQLKLLLLKMYNIIGAVGASYGMYESIDVKHIQQETLGYLIVEPLLCCAFYSTASVILGNSIRFFTGNYKDTVDYLISCYKFGSFTKIPELVKFREQVNNSFQYAIATVERMILDLLLETKSYQETEKTISSMEIDPEKG